MARRKTPPSWPLRQIGVRQTLPACAETMSFSPSWCGPSCDRVVKPTNRVCPNLFAWYSSPRWHAARRMPWEGVGRRDVVVDCWTDDRIAAMGIAQGVCSVALPSLNDSQQAKIIAIVVVMMCASTLAVLLRLVARYLSTARYGYDDLFIVIALVSHDLGRGRADWQFGVVGLILRPRF